MTVIGDASKARIIAAGIDNLIALVLAMVAIAMLPEDFPTAKAVLFVVFYLMYFIVLEALWSRTLGKFFQGLVVRKLDGSRCGLKAALIRGLLRVIEVNPLLLGGLPAGIAIITTERKQRIGDLLAETVVVSNKLVWKTDPADPIEPPVEQTISV